MYDYHMMNGYGYGWGSVWGFIMMLFWLAFFIIGIAVFVRYIKRQENHAGHNHNVNPIDIAKERYAKGEIDKHQFEQLKKDLK